MQKTHNVSKKNWAAKLMAIVVVVSMVASTLVLFAPEASARTGSDSYSRIRLEEVTSFITY